MHMISQKSNLARFDLLPCEFTLTHMNDRLQLLSTLSLTAIAIIISGSTLYNVFSPEGHALLGQSVPVQNAPIYNYTSEQTAQGIIIYANSHNFFSCADIPAIDIDPLGIGNHTSFWVYEFNGNEPPYSGRYHISRKKLSETPSLVSAHTLQTFTAQKRYYVVTERDMAFSCTNGLSSKAYCGDGVISEGEECDTGTGMHTGCDSACAIVTGYQCDGEPSRCSQIIPILPSDDTTAQKAEEQSDSSSSSSQMLQAAPQESSSSSSVSTMFPWTTNEEDDLQEQQHLASATNLYWGQCGPDTEYCIRYVSHKVQGNTVSIRVRVDTDPFDIDQKDYDYVSANLLRRDDNGAWLNVTPIKNDQYWGRSPYPVFERSITVNPGRHMYKVTLHKGRVNTFGIPNNKQILLEEIEFPITIDKPDPDVAIEELHLEYTGAKTEDATVQYTGRISGYVKNRHIGYINWGRGLIPFPIEADGTFDFDVSKKGNNPKGAQYLEYCPVNLMILSPSANTSNPLAGATIYDRKIVCPF